MPPNTSSIDLCYEEEDGINNIHVNAGDYTSDPIIYVNGKIAPNLDCITPNMTLLSFLREHCQLTGSKLGCGEGGCGACTVMLSSVSEVIQESCNGSVPCANAKGADIGEVEREQEQQRKIRHRSVNACLFPALAAHGCHVTTVEGIGNTTDPHPIQKLVVDLHGSQCGYCTPGIVMSLFSNTLDGTNNMDVDGNLCR